MTKKDNKNIAHKLGAEKFDYLTREESKKLHDNGWRVFSASFDKNGNESSIIISNGKKYMYINNPCDCNFKN